MANAQPVCEALTALTHASIMRPDEAAPAGTERLDYLCVHRACLDGALTQAAAAPPARREENTVTVRGPNKETVRVPLPAAGASVATLAQQAASAMGLPAAGGPWELVHDGAPLDDARPFAGPVLRLRRRGGTEQRINVKIRSLSNKETTVSISEAACGAELRAVTAAQLGVPGAQLALVHDGKRIADTALLSEHSIGDAAVISATTRLVRGKKPAQCFVYDPAFLNPAHDFDFTNVDDSGSSFVRGGRPYRRPVTYQRLAIRVEHFGDNAWIGCANKPGEWAVSYHGTNGSAAARLSGQHGGGVYTTPDVATAEQFAEQFTVGGARYKVLLQNRINPATLREVDTALGKFFVSPGADDLRPYGLLLKRVP